MQNLDYIAAKCAETILSINNNNKDELKRVTNTGLSILHQQGIYALFCWLLSEKDKVKIAENLCKMFTGALDGQFILVRSLSYQPTNLLNSLNSIKENLTKDLKIMFLARDLISLTLIYTKYMTKAL